MSYGGLCDSCFVYCLFHNLPVSLAQHKLPKYYIFFSSSLDLYKLSILTTFPQQFYLPSGQFHNLFPAALPSFLNLFLAFPSPGGALGGGV